MGSDLLLRFGCGHGVTFSFGESKCGKMTIIKSSYLCSAEPLLVVFAAKHRLSESHAAIYGAWS